MWLQDRLANLVSAMGTQKDKATHSRHYLRELTQPELLNMYRGDWISRKVVDIPAFDMIREGRDWKADKTDIEKLEKEEKRLQIWPKLAKALQLARLYGGSALILGDGTERPNTPLDPERIAQGGLKFIHVASRYDIRASGQIDKDPMSPGWGEPLGYEMTGTGNRVLIHPSRVIPFLGAGLPDLNFSDGWGDSVLLAVEEAIENAGVAGGAIAQLLQEAKIDVFKLKNFMANVGDEAYRNKVLTRLSLANQGKSISNALVMDAEEEWDQKQISFAQLPEVLQLFLQIAAGAADIPVTRLLGQSPAGMNSTGESDVRNYYDRLAAEQKVFLRPRVERLDEVLIRSSLGARPDEVHFAFSPLWQLGEKEQADIFKTKADGARTLAGNGGTSEPLLPIEALSDALVNTFIEDGSLPGLEAAMAEYGRLSEQDDDDDDEEAALAAPAPPQIPVAANDATPRTLYVQRKLTNADEFIAWAKGQGFKSTTPAGDLHVTIAFSRVAVDWMKASESWSGQDGKLTVQPGGARLVEKLGDKGAVVLLFNSSELGWRHEAIRREAGASWDFPEYQPHVTITYQGGDLDLSKVEPYRGKLVFGPEIFEEINEDWALGLKEA